MVDIRAALAATQTTPWAGMLQNLLAEGVSFNDAAEQANEASATGQSGAPPVAQRPASPPPAATPASPLPSAEGGGVIPDAISSVTDALGFGDGLSPEAERFGMAALQRRGVAPAMARLMLQNPEMLRAAVPRLYPAGDAFRAQNITMRGDDGRTYMVQMGKGGARRIIALDGLSPDRAPQHVDTGTGTLIHRDGNQIGYVPKDVEGSAEARERGTQRAKLRANMPVAQNALIEVNSRQLDSLQRVERLLNGIDWHTTGMLGPLFGRVWTSDAYGFRKQIETLKARIGFDELQRMRELSSTGGALGNVTEREITFLQATLGSLDPAQGGAEMRRQLKGLRDYYRNSIVSRQRAFQQTYGNVQPQTAPGAAPAPVGPTVGAPGNPFGLNVGNR